MAPHGEAVEHSRVSAPVPAALAAAVARPVFDRLLLTGAAGGLGRELRPRLRRLARVLRASDVAEMAPAGEGEEVMTAALQDAAAVDRIVAGSDAIVHLGGISTEGAFAPILEANIVGVWHLYEAARRHGVRRIVFASSNHVTGFYRQDEVIPAGAPPKPDGLYGLSKAFGEDLAQLYFDRHGIETVSLRIGSSFEKPRDRRMLHTWMSFDDMERLVLAALTAKEVGHSIICGVSANPHVWWDNAPAAHIGYVPRDSSAPFVDEIEHATPPGDPADPAVIYQGGAFVKQGPAK